MVNVADFIAKVQAVHKTGVAREHAYRPALHDLLKSLGDQITPVNDPAKCAVGAPDFIVFDGEIVIGHLEAKDLDIDLRKLKDANKKQHERYTGGLANLIYTNCLDWDFYRDGQLMASITIADFLMGIQPKPEEFAALENLLLDFVAQRPQSITSPRDLAERMAGKAVLIKDVLFQTLRQDIELRTDLAGQFKAFKEHLIHDISSEDFADIYAETIAYGMFAARLHDRSLDTFSRFEALELLPKSNPFLRDLFGYIAGATLDDRIAWVIDDLARVFQAANVKKLMEAFGKLTGQQDPFLHFYETFLAAYNPAKRKARGVWYTPEPVVNFIVRAVDEVLQTEFGLPEGLADTSKVTIDWDTGATDPKGKPVTIKKEVHRVQILDPATGTGTFLAEVIKQIAPKVKDVAEGMWSPYIERDLIPRLHGFELLMASYAMCHMKLDMILTELGYKPTGTPPRLGVYLTNSLEEGEREVRDLFMAQWLTREAREANAIKRQTPIMCVVGNPPYNIMSGNLSEHQVSLIEPYRWVDGKRIKEKGMLQFEKNINNDYVKFIAFAEALILKTGFGVLGYVTSHAYLKSASFRGMRQRLMTTFDSVYILDLHGNSEIKEVTPNNIKDKNIFDIKQGVSVIIATRLASKCPKTPAKVQYAEFWGARDSKYARLSVDKVSSLDWADCKPASPNYTFHPSGAESGSYQTTFFSVAKLMSVYSSGVITARDEFSISEDGNALVRNAQQFAGNEHLSDVQIATKLGIAIKKGWDIGKARLRLRGVKDLSKIIYPISYRPLDTRKIIFDESVVWTTARSTMEHMLRGENIALVSARSEKSGTCSHFYISRFLVETKCGERTTQSAVFPLYLYPSEQDLDQSRRINFDAKLYARLQTLAKHPTHGTPDEVVVFDYIYGVLHCPAYRATYAEFLKIDFPRIPWPASPDEFWDVSAKGTQLRKLHLMDPATIGPTPYPFKGEGNAVVEKPRLEDGKVWINATQYFDAAPETSWTFYIGGYQPAQKWLKDRRGRVLNFEDVKHYQRILKILAETDRIMQTISMTLVA